MFLIKTETRELKIDNGNGERYFDAILKMMLDERKPTINGGIASGTANPPVTEQTVEKEGREEGVKGFVHLTCSRCGRTKTTFWKNRQKAYRCCDCGKETELGYMRKAYAECECGHTAYYLTNSQAEVLSIPCVACGAPMNVKWNPEKECYETMRK